MLKDPTRTINIISSWLNDYIRPTGRTNLYLLEGNEEGVPALSKNVLNKILRDHTHFTVEHATPKNLGVISSSGYGIIISPIERTYGYLTREYKKHKNGPRDIFPMYELYLSEIRQIASVLGVNYSPPTPEEVLQEWAIRENEKNGIIEADPSPVLAKNWYRYTLEQKQTLSQKHQREKATRHKKINGPFCPLRSDPEHRKTLFDK